MKPWSVHIIIQKILINIFTDIDFISDYISPVDLCGKVFYDIVTTWLLERSKDIFKTRLVRNVIFIVSIFKFSSCQKHFEDV